MVVLHGLLGSSRNWQTVGAGLAASHHVCALDLRNHGRSAHDEEAGYVAMVDDVLGWMNACGAGRVSLMGHSMGGKVAMQLACRHSSRVERLIVVDIAPKAYQSAGHRAEFAAMNELDLRTIKTRAEAEMRMEARVPDWAMRKFLTTNLDRDDDTNAWRWLVNLPGLTRALPELEASPLTAGDRYDGPALFIMGEKSRYVLPGDRLLIETHFPAARFETIAGAGHNPHMETRDAFLKAVREFA